MKDENLSEEEFKAKLKQISDEVKADIKAGRYKSGVIHPKTSANTVPDFSKDYTKEVSTKPDEYVYDKIHEWVGAEYAAIENKLLKAALIYGRSMGKSELSSRYLETHYINPDEIWLPKMPKVEKEKDWDQTKYTPGPCQTPSEEKRKALRAKRKAKKIHQQKGR